VTALTTATGATRGRGRMVVGSVMMLLAMPVVFALIEAVSFSVRNRTNGAIISSGQKRTYILHVPGSCDRTRPAPLVISLHGAAGWPAQQMDMSQWNRQADEQGFIVVYPSGDEAEGPRLWHVGEGPGLTRDVRFISELIDKLEAAYNIDPARIYANGLSNGGAMAFVLSCRLSDRISAVGMVAAAQTLPWTWCTTRRPMPMIAFHGTADRIIPYEGGRSPIASGLFPSVPTWTANWARRNQCETKPTESAVAADVTRIQYGNCAQGAAVVLYRVQGGGHSWPGGKPLPQSLVGPTSRSIDASRLMWAFFREHPLPEKSDRSSPAQPASVAQAR
jgi:polyhydroxybutyrate depolymerase